MSAVSSLAPKLTDEELLLKEKYELIRRIKKAVQAEANQQSVAKTEPEKRNTTKRSIEEAEGATEEAKRLVKSGAMQIRKVREKQTFKRSKLLDRKIKEGDGAGVKFQPYSSTMLGDFASSSNEALDSKPEMPNLYASFVESDEKVGGASGSSDERVYRRSGGNTIYVRAYDLVENPLRNAFQKYGTIVELTIDERRRSATIQYEDNVAADKAIREMNGNMLNGITLRVSMARKQFVSSPAKIQADVPATNQHAWAQLATGGSSKESGTSREEKRNLVSYDDDVDFN